MTTFKIADREVGPDAPPLVIAEIGINHGGSLAVAKEMVDAAARAGVEVVKHQTHVVEDEMSPAARKVVPGNADISIYEIMEQARLTLDEEVEFKNYVEALGMIYLSTPFSRAAADFLADLNVAAFKIGSGECNNYPLVDHIASFGKPVILSTGMNSIDSVRPSADILRKRGVPFALLHCTNLYPTPYRLVRLGAMVELQEAFPDAVIGLSDHSLGNYACFGAVALGARILERHFTDHMDREGPDIVCSMDEAETADLIRGANAIFEARGGGKAPAPEEQVTMDFAFATAVTLKPVAAGEAFTRDNLWLRRPGVGEITPADYEGILGRAATRDLGEGEHLAWADVAT